MTSKYAGDSQKRWQSHFRGSASRDKGTVQFTLIYPPLFRFSRQLDVCDPIGKRTQEPAC
jgi:hypothetical protein